MAFDFAAAYGDLNTDDRDYRFYAELALECQATRVLDLGCGTGTLTRLLASQGHKVDWRLGFSDRADTASADFAVMSGHVAQVFRDEAAWTAALHDLHRALVPHGTLAFESRNPAARAWEHWTRQATLRTLDTEEGRVEFWHETAWVSLPLVAYDTLTRNLDTHRETSDRDVLAFREPASLKDSLDATGFSILSQYGDWQRTSLTPQSPEIIVVAYRP